MAPKYALAVVLVAVMICGTLANDVPVMFCVKDCYGNAITDRSYQVQMSGCTDRPATCMTQPEDGCCTIERSRDAIQYCSGSAGYLCQWSILSGYTPVVVNSLTAGRRHLSAVANLVTPMEPFIPDTPTFVNSLGGFVTPHTFSGCKCDGSDSCNNVIYQDKETSMPYTVIFTPASCGCNPVLEGIVVPDLTANQTINPQPLRKLL